MKWQFDEQNGTARLFWLLDNSPIAASQTFTRAIAIPIRTAILALFFEH
jgi:hypothetical protein